MALNEFLKKITGRFDENNLGKTVGDIDRVSGLTSNATEAISGERESLLTKTLSAGAKAALAAGALAGMIAPEVTGIIAATAFIGAGLYKLYKESFQKAATNAISNDGLTPVGRPIANGRTAQIQNALMQGQQTVR